MIANSLSLWRRFRKLDSGDRRLVIEAAMLLGIIQTGFYVLPFSTLRRVLAAAKHLRQRPHHLQSRIGWAVAAAARLVPGRTCLSEALAADLMLCRRGYESSLLVGVKNPTGGAHPLEAHAWVVSAGVIVAGDLPTLSEYQPFPDRAT